MLREAIVAATENTIRLYELSGGVIQDVEKGAFREFFVAGLIHPLLPHHFGVGSGVVVSSNGMQSRQSDIIIYDRRLLQPILLAGDRGIFPIDSVLAVIEVKSILQATHYETLVDAARRLSSPTEENPNGLPIATEGTRVGDRGQKQALWPLYSVFSYTADAARDEFERLEAKAPDGINYIRLIGVLDKGVWSRREGSFPDDKPENNSVKFLIYLLNRLEETAASRGKFRLQDWLS